jgi:DNA-damage-inducible protein J
MLRIYSRDGRVFAINDPQLLIPRNKIGALRYNVSQEIKMATTMVHVRIDGKVKTRAAKNLAAMGLSVSDAVRLMLMRVASEKALPFEVRTPNARTVRALQTTESGRGKRFRSSKELLNDLGI